MKTKRGATTSPYKPEEITPPTQNLVNPSLEKDMACTLVTTKPVETQSSTKKARCDNNGIIRRSQRIKNAVYCQPMIRDIEPPVIQILDHSGSEKDDLRNSEELYQEPELNQSRIQDVNLAPQIQDPAGNEQENADDHSEENSLQPEPEQPVQEGTKKPSTGFQNKSEMRYRSLYIESQKKLEELTQANNELSKKLAVAEGKLEVYEKGSGILSSILDKTKDTFMASALSKATKQALALTTSPVKPGRKPSTAATKRKPVASPG